MLVAIDGSISTFVAQNNDTYHDNILDSWNVHSWTLLSWESYDSQSTEQQWSCFSEFLIISLRFVTTCLNTRPRECENILPGESEQLNKNTQREDQSSSFADSCQWLREVLLLSKYWKRIRDARLLLQHFWADAKTESVCMNTSVFSKEEDGGIRLC